MKDGQRLPQILKPWYNGDSEAFLWLNSISYANLDFLREAVPDVPQKNESRFKTVVKSATDLNFQIFLPRFCVSLIYCILFGTTREPRIGPKSFKLCTLLGLCWARQMADIPSASVSLRDSHGEVFPWKSHQNPRPRLGRPAQKLHS